MWLFNAGCQPCCSAGTVCVGPSSLDGSTAFSGAIADYYNQAGYTFSCTNPDLWIWDATVNQPPGAAPIAEPLDWLLQGDRRFIIITNRTTPPPGPGDSVFGADPAGRVNQCLSDIGVAMRVGLDLNPFFGGNTFAHIGTEPTGTHPLVQGLAVTPSFVRDQRPFVLQGSINDSRLLGGVVVNGEPILVTAPGFGGDGKVLAAVETVPGTNSQVVVFAGFPSELYSGLGVSPPGGPFWLKMIETGF